MEKTKEILRLDKIDATIRFIKRFIDGRKGGSKKLQSTQAAKLLYCTTCFLPDVVNMDNAGNLPKQHQEFGPQGHFCFNCGVVSDVGIEKVSTYYKRLKGMRQRILFG